MARIHLVGTGTLSHLHTTPKRPSDPLAAPLCTPVRFLGGGVPGKNPMHQLCSTLRVYGCNVHPMRAGTTHGEYEVVSRRNVSKFGNLGK